MTLRVLPPNGAAASITVFGRSYTCAAGAYLDVPDSDAFIMETNGWVIAAHMGVGATSGRPTTNLVKGKRYFDSTLGYTIVWTGASWINPSNGNVV
jgi:hypothetical protein